MAAELPKPLTPHDFFKLAILESWPVLYIGLAYGALSLIQQLLYPDGKGFFLSEIFVKWGFWKWVAIWAVMFMVVAFYCAFSFSRDLNKKLIEVLTPRVSVAFDQNMMFDEGDKKIACITLTGLSVKTAENIEVYCVGAESIKLGRTLLNLKTGPASHSD